MISKKPVVSLVQLVLLACSLVVSAGVPEVILQGKERDLISVEQRIQRTYKVVRPAVVRIVKGDDSQALGSGVIVTAEGHVITADVPVHRAYQTDLVTVLLPGERRVEAKALGYLAEGSIGVMQITEDGPWPYVKLDMEARVDVERHCVVLGYPRSQGVCEFDLQPTIRLASVTKSAPSVWFSASVGGDVGSGVFDLDGRLIGIAPEPHIKKPHFANIQLFGRHWHDLVTARPGDSRRHDKSTVQTPDRSSPSAAENRLNSTALQIAKASTVRIRHIGEDKGGWSGVIVSQDGFIITCAHTSTSFLPGDQVNVLLSDGRQAAGKLLGTNRLSDVGLAKITEEGPWPYSKWGQSRDMKPGDPCIALGYPGTSDDLEPRLRHAVVSSPATRYPPWRFLSTSSAERAIGGESGGGLFDLDGRVVAVHHGGPPGGQPSQHVRVELIRNQWESLLRQKRHEVNSSEPLVNIESGFRQVVKTFPPIVVEVLADDRQRALGTIVRQDGLILTKASELYGQIACRLADGRILPATIQATSREHDVALLKIEANKLPQPPWSERRDPAAGSLIAAATPGGRPLVGVVSQAVRRIDRDPGWLLIGDKPVQDAEYGVEVQDDTYARRARTPIRVGDVIVKVQGQRVLDSKTYRSLTESEIGFPHVAAGDPIHLEVLRGKRRLELRFPVPSESDLRPPLDTSYRKSDFPAVFDTDVPLHPKSCGGPIIDRQGHVVGISIACNEYRRSYVIPCHVVQRVMRSLLDALEE